MGEAIGYPGATLERISQYTSHQNDPKIITSLPEGVEINEIHPPALNRQGLRHNFGLMRERFRLAKRQIRALGHLAILELDKAHTTLQEHRVNPPPEEQDYEKPSFKERIRQQADDIDYEKKLKKEYIQHEGLGWAAMMGTPAAISYLVSRYFY